MDQELSRGIPVCTRCFCRLLSIYSSIHVCVSMAPLFAGQLHSHVYRGMGRVETIFGGTVESCGIFGIATTLLGLAHSPWVLQDDSREQARKEKGIDMVDVD